MIISIVIRTLNEGKYLPELLEAIKSQRKSGFDIETVIIDSGSKDNTIEIAKRFNAKLHL